MMKLPGQASHTQFTKADPVHFKAGRRSILLTVPVICLPIISYQEPNKVMAGPGHTSVEGRVGEPHPSTGP